MLSGKVVHMILFYKLLVATAFGFVIMALL